MASIKEIQEHNSDRGKLILKAFGQEIEKGHKNKALLGEIRTFGNRQYIKTIDGWKFHGKGTGKRTKEHIEGIKGERIKRVSNFVNPDRTKYNIVGDYDIVKDGEKAKISVQYNSIGKTYSYSGKTKSGASISGNNVSEERMREILGKQENISKSHKLEVGQKVNFEDSSGNLLQGKVVSITPEKNSIDGNKRYNVRPIDKSWVGQVSFTEKPQYDDELSFDRITNEKESNVPDVVGTITGVHGEKNRQEKEQLQNIVEGQFKGFKIQKSGTPDKPRYIISDYSHNHEHSFLIDEDKDHPAGRYYVNMTTKVVVSSRSLADPRAAYQTTSASFVRHAKKNTTNYTDTLEGVQKLIERHMKKIKTWHD